MNLPEELVSELVKVTNNNTSDKNDNTAYGTVVDNGDRLYVQLDGAGEGVLTPIETTVSIKAGDRVRVSIRNHTAVVTGNALDNSASVSELLKAIKLIQSLDENVNGIGILLNGKPAEGENPEVIGIIAKVNQNGIAIGELGTQLTGYVTFDSLGENGTTEIHGSRIKTGTISAKDIVLTGAITWNDLDDAIASDIDDAISSAAENGDTALTRINRVTNTTGTKTIIDPDSIETGSIYADKLHLGGSLTVYKTMDETTAVGGYLGYDSGFNSQTGIGVRHSSGNAQMVCTNQAARLSYGSTAQFIASSNGYAYVQGVNIVFTRSGVNYVAIGETCLRPHNDAPSTMVLGTSAYPWANIYSKSSEGITSDRNKKHSIEDLPDEYLTIFDNLTPRRFKLNDGTSDRYHVGYIAQEVEEAMKTAGIDSKDFAGFIKDVHEEDGSDIYMLRYGEFDAIYAAKIKQLESRIDELEKRLKSIEEVG